MSPAPEAEREPGRGAPQPPRQLKWAVRLMYLGAILSALGIVRVLAMRGSIEGRILKGLNQQGQAVPAGQVHMISSAVLAMSVVFGLIAIVLWVLMAILNRRGRQWARIVATVLGALNILSLLSGLTNPAGSPLQLGLRLLGIVLAAAILVLLWSSPSGEWFSAMRRYREAGTAQEG